MLHLEIIAEWVEILYQQGLREVVLSPGSRPAPLTILFARHPGIKKYVIPDERSAAFVALGIARAQNRPVALVCTSGSAGLNYAPAVAEAFYSYTPLIILTADRPPEWIDMEDGQTIRQFQLYGRHVLGSFQMPDFLQAQTKRQSTRMINEAYLISIGSPSGPVHINIPLREPFYPLPNQIISYPEHPPIVHCGIAQPAQHQVKNPLIDIQGKLLIVVSQYCKPSQILIEQLIALHNKGAVIVGEIGSGLYFEGCIHHQDLFISEEIYDQLRPDVVLSFGHHPLSKNLKLLLRSSSALKHIALDGGEADTYGSLHAVLKGASETWIDGLLQSTTSFDKDFQKAWQLFDSLTAEFLTEFNPKSTPLAEWPASNVVWNRLPKGSTVHLANSMAVRYANFWGNTQHHRFDVFVNRGTSGIDGSNSTAVGHALAHPEKLVFLLTGDMAFFYDRNAFWHNHIPDNLRIVVFNNHGGGIFRMLPEARQQPELETYFETQQHLTAVSLCTEAGFAYFCASDLQTLDETLEQFLAHQNQSAVLEIFVDSQQSVTFLSNFKQKLKSHPHYGRLESN